MITRRRLTASVGALCGTVALMAWTMVPAGAQVDIVSDVAQFVGQTSGLTPVQLVGGGGSYNFSSIVCNFASDLDLGDAGGISTTELGQCAVNVTGATYSNIVCGTGSTSGPAVVSVNGDGNPTGNVNYNITFVAGEGVVTGNVASETAPAGDNDAGGAIDGAASIIPTAGNCVQGVNAFEAVVEILILEPPTGS